MSFFFTLNHISLWHRNSKFKKSFKVLDFSPHQQATARKHVPASCLFNGKSDFYVFVFFVWVIFHIQRSFFFCVFLYRKMCSYVSDFTWCIIYFLCFVSFVCCFLIFWTCASNVKTYVWDFSILIYGYFYIFLYFGFRFYAVSVSRNFQFAVFRPRPRILSPFPSQCCLGYDKPLEHGTQSWIRSWRA